MYALQQIPSSSASSQPKLDSPVTDFDHSSPQRRGRGPGFSGVFLSEPSANTIGILSGCAKSAAIDRAAVLEDTSFPDQDMTATL